MSAFLNAIARNSVKVTIWSGEKLANGAIHVAGSLGEAGLVGYETAKVEAPAAYARVSALAETKLGPQSRADALARINALRAARAAAEAVSPLRPVAA